MHDADHEIPDAAQPAPAARADDERPEFVEPIPQPKSAYEMPSRKNTVLRNMVWALALTMAVVVVIAIAFFGVGSDPERTTLENSELDVAASAERAQEVAPFPIAVPEAGEGWMERSARYTAGASPRWNVEYTSPGGQLVAFVQGSELGAPMISAAIPGSSVVEEFTLQGAECSELRGGEKGSEVNGVACEGEDWGFLVHGTEGREVLEQLAAAAITSLD